MPFTQKTVLCVDDDLNTTEMIRSVLAQINPNYRLVTVPDASRAVTLIAERSFDLYIIGYRDDKRCGLELCRWIRKNDESMPILFYSSSTNSSDIQSAKEAGANEYLVKTRDDEKLAAVIESLINLRPTIL